MKEHAESFDVVGRNVMNEFTIMYDALCEMRKEGIDGLISDVGMSYIDQPSNFSCSRL